MADIDTSAATVTGSPEFKEAVAEAVAKAVRDALAMRAETQPAMPQFMEMMRDSFKSLALEINSAAREQTNSEKQQRGEPVPLSAAEKKSRDDARITMGELIMDSRSLPEDQRPLYRVMSTLWISEHLLQPYERVQGYSDPQPKRIRYTGEPNLQMLPVNESAKAIYGYYLRYLGGTGAINEVVNQFGISLTHRHEQWISEKGHLTTVAPGVSDRSRAHVEADPFDLDVFALPATGADDVLGIRTADDPRQKEISVLGSVHEPARRGNFTDRVQLQSAS